MLSAIVSTDQEPEGKTRTKARKRKKPESLLQLKSGRRREKVFLVGRREEVPSRSLNLQDGFTWSLVEKMMSIFWAERIL